MATIGKSITIKGDLTGSEDVQLEGSVEGRVDLPDHELTVGPEGRVNAEIHAKNVVVTGHVHGNISAIERIEIQAAGVVEGDVRAPRLIVHEGAVVNGSIEMGEVKASGGRATPAGAKPGPPPAPKVAAGGEG